MEKFTTTTTPPLLLTSYNYKNEVYYQEKMLVRRPALPTSIHSTSNKSIILIYQYFNIFGFGWFGYSDSAYVHNNEHCLTILLFAYPSKSKNIESRIVPESTHYDTQFEKVLSTV